MTTPLNPSVVCRYIFSHSLHTGKSLSDALVQEESSLQVFDQHLKWEELMKWGLEELEEEDDEENRS